MANVGDIVRVDGYPKWLFILEKRITWPVGEFWQAVTQSAGEFRTWNVNVEKAIKVCEGPLESDDIVTSDMFSGVKIVAGQTGYIVHFRDGSPSLFRGYLKKSGKADTVATTSYEMSAEVMQAEFKKRIEQAYALIKKKAMEPPPQDQVNACKEIPINVVKGKPEPIEVKRKRTFSRSPRTHQPVDVMALNPVQDSRSIQGLINLGLLK
jgi:hypothetical protein